jgi:hypothetical protein
MRIDRAMSLQTPLFTRPSGRPLHLFPTRGVPGGWRDPWDDDPRDALLELLLHRDVAHRHVAEGRVQLDFEAEPGEDGRWLASVISPPMLIEQRPVHWPSVNGPTAMVALDALEAEVREVLHTIGTL